jgi:toxin ParE1/3/4
VRDPIITDAAQANLDEAWSYLARRSLKAADALIDRFLQKALVHAEFPESGRPREDLGPGLRNFVVTP